MPWRRASRSTRKGGILVVTGMSHDPQAETVKLPGTIMSAWAKTVVGVLYGLCSPHHDIPMLVDLWRRGQLNLADAVTNRYAARRHQPGYQDLDDGNEHPRRHRAQRRHVRSAR